MEGKGENTFWVTFWALRPRAYARNSISLLLHNPRLISWGNSKAVGLETYSRGGSHCD